MRGLFYFPPFRRSTSPLKMERPHRFPLLKASSTASASARTAHIKKYKNIYFCYFSIFFDIFRLVQKAQESASKKIFENFTSDEKIFMMICHGNIQGTFQGAFAPELD
ncbi:MAG: hypothetical protein K2H09_07545 [Treponemataceae bacterium]|nr:hypothetical protein [Treponemataceae bacterium]